MAQRVKRPSGERIHVTFAARKPCAMRKEPLQAAASAAIVTLVLCFELSSRSLSQFPTRIDVVVAVGGVGVGVGDGDNRDAITHGLAMS